MNKKRFRYSHQSKQWDELLHFDLLPMTVRPPITHSLKVGNVSASSYELLPRRRELLSIMYHGKTATLFFINNSRSPYHLFNFEK